MGSQQERLLEDSSDFSISQQSEILPGVINQALEIVKGQDERWQAYIEIINA